MGADGQGWELKGWLEASGVELPERPLLLATDFTGSAEAAWALHELGVRFRHVFASEKGVGARRFLAQNPVVRPEALHRSASSRVCDFAGRAVAPPRAHVDLYAVGPLLGEGDLEEVLRYIAEHRPKTVLVRASSPASGGALERALSEAAAGYRVEALPVDNAPIGLPQEGRYDYVLLVQEALAGGEAAGAGGVLARLRAHAAATRARDGAAAAEELLEAGRPSAGAPAEEGAGARGGEDGGLPALAPMAPATAAAHLRLREALGVAAEDDRYLREEGARLARAVQTMREADLVQIHALACRNRGAEARFLDAALLADLRQDASGGAVPQAGGFSTIWSYRLRRLLSTRDLLVLRGLRPERLELAGVGAAATQRLACLSASVHASAAAALAALGAAELDRLGRTLRPLLIDCGGQLPMAIVRSVAAFLGLPWEPDAWPIGK